MNTDAIIFDRNSGAEEQSLSGSSVKRIGDAYTKIYGEKKYCNNCGELISGKGIEIEVEQNFPGNEGAPEYDAPVIRHLCSEGCID